MGYFSWERLWETRRFCRERCGNLRGNFGGGKFFKCKTWERKIFAARVQEVWGKIKVFARRFSPRFSSFHIAQN